MKKLSAQILLACSIQIVFANVDTIYRYSEYAPRIELHESAEVIKTKQDQIFRQMQQEYTCGEYTLDNPYIRINPFEHNPLSALIKFYTPVATKVKLTIKSKTGNASDDIVVVFPARQHHHLKVFLLYNNHLNEVLLETDNTSKTLYLQTQDVLVNDYKTNIYDNSKLLPPSYMFFSGKTAHDKYGNIRFSIQSLPSFLLRQVARDEFQIGPLRINGFGRILKIYKKPSSYHHEIFVLPRNKGVLTFTGLYELSLLKYDVISKVLDLRELETPEGEKINYQVICSNHQINQTHWCKMNDWFHANSLWYQEEDNSLIISLRTLLVVVKIDMNDYKIKWVFGPGLEIFKGLDDYKLTPTFNDKMLYNYGQHQVSVLPNGNLFMFNNRDWVQFLNPLWQVPDYASGDEYKINEEQKTIDHVRSYGLDKKITVRTQGGAQGLPGDRRLVLFPNKFVDDKMIFESQYVLYDNDGHEIAEGIIPWVNYRLMAYDIYEGMTE